MPRSFPRTFPRVTWPALLLALLLSLPTLRLGFALDDHLHLLILEGRWPLGGPWDLFRFAGGAGMRRLVEEGPYPWWTLPGVSVSFWRPLSSGLEALDFRLFGRAPLGWHVHSLLWHLACVAALAGVLGRVLPGSLGALALLLFTADEAHLLPVGWLSNRNALVSLALGLLGLRLHLEWRGEGRERGRAWALPASLLAFAAALAGGESAVGVLAYAVAYEALGAREQPAGRRVRALLPLALLAAGYLALYRALGHGAVGSGFYLDPVREPGAYLLGALGRLPALAGGLVGVPVDVWALAPGSRPWLVALGLLAPAVLGWGLRHAWGTLTPDERRHTAWLLLGGGLSLVPLASAVPMSRLLLVPGVGGAVALAVVLRHAWRLWRAGRRAGGQDAAAGAPSRVPSRVRGRRRLLGLGAGLALVHGVLALPLWPVMAALVGELGQGPARLAAQAAGELNAQEVPRQRVVVLAAHDVAAAMYVPMHWALEGRPRPRAYWTLSLAPLPPAVTRTGPASLELSLPPGARFLESELEQALRAPGHPLPVGEAVALPGLTARVLAADAGGPTRLGFTFDVPLEDPSLVFLRFEGGRLVRAAPPPPGASVQLPSVLPPPPGA
jgi:hypothetical protein